MGSSFQHSSQKERDVFSSSVCNRIGIKQEAPALDEGQNVSASWFSTGRHIVPPHCHRGPFSCSPPGWSPEWALLIILPQLLWSQEGLAESCTSDG